MNPDWTLTEDAHPPGPDDEAGHVVPLVGYTLPQLATRTFPERKPLLWRGDTVVFRAGQICQLFAERGIGKTWVSQTIGLVAATSGEALGFSAHTPCRVLYIDGEMGSDEIKSRFHELEDRLHIPPPETLTVVAADWQEDFLPRLDTPLGQALIEPFVDAHDLIVIDNRATLFDPNGERDPKAWQPAQEWLLSLRRRGKATWIVHHSNRMGGARGISNPEDPMNLIIKLARPEDYQPSQGARCLVTFEKYRGFYGEAVEPFHAHLTPEGWQMHGLDALVAVRQKLMDHITLTRKAGEPVKSASKAIAAVGVNKQTGLKAWASLLEANRIAKHPDGGFYVV